MNGDAASATAAALVAEGIEAVSCAGDVGKRADADAMVSAAVRHFGGVDILVANAGIVRAAPFLDMTEEARRGDEEKRWTGEASLLLSRVLTPAAAQDFDEVLRVNLKGVFLVRVAWRGATRRGAVLRGRCC